LQKLQTAPVSFIFTDDVLITVRPAQSRTIESLQQNCWHSRRAAIPHNATRMPSSPTDLMLRLLNAMVDQYLELRQPLTQQLDRWQQALLNPRRPFNNWMALLEARMELRRLDNLCEEQHDALQELRDHLVDT
jgi:Mg2+ and Co2+ transporter CorA